MSYKPFSPISIKITKTYLDFAVAALTNDIEIFSLPAGFRITAITIVPTVAFEGGAIATYTLSTGIAGNLAKFSTAHDIKQTATQQDSNNFSIESWAVATSIRAAVIATGANLNQAERGSVDIYIELTQVKR